MPKIFITTPTPRGDVSGPFAESLQKLTIELTQNRHGFVVYRTVGFDVSEQRDAAAQRFMESDCSHLLAIDSDMTFEPSLYAEMLELRKELVGAAYTHRYLDVDNALALVERGTPRALAVAASYKFTVEPMEDNRIEGHGKNLYKVGGVGMGFALVARSVFDRLLPTTKKYRTPQGLDVYNFFERVEIDSSRKGEDISFCHRFINAGGEVFAYSSTKIGHIGSVVHRASFADHIEAMRQKPTIKAAE